MTDIKGILFCVDEPQYTNRLIAAGIIMTISTLYLLHGHNIQIWGDWFL